MKFKTYDKRLILLVIAAVFMIIVLLTGCGNKDSQELADYRDNMEEFYNKLSYYDEKINAIDSGSEGAKYELLVILDQMNEAYRAMAKYEIPDAFSGISEISAEAADYMQMADEFYHMAYDGDFDENNEQLARQYYERANSRAKVMLQVLHGEVPSGEGISVTTQEPGEFSTIGVSTE